MEDTFIEYFTGTGIGYTIAIICGAITVTISIIKGIKKIKLLYDTRIQEKMKRDQEEQLFKQNVTESLNNIHAISNKVSDLAESINQLNTDFTDFKNETSSRLSDMSKKQKVYNQELEVLLESDKEAIKAYIISEFQKWSKLKYIDIYAMQCIETRYEKYLKENGNTFISTLMGQLRKLPNKYMITTDHNDEKYEIDEDSSNHKNSSES